MFSSDRSASFCSFSPANPQNTQKLYFLLPFYPQSLRIKTKRVVPLVLPTKFKAHKTVNLLKSAHCLLQGTENKLAGNIILKHGNNILTNTASVSAHTHHPPRETKNQQTKIDKNKKRTTPRNKQQKLSRELPYSAMLL